MLRLKEIKKARDLGDDEEADHLTKVKHGTQQISLQALILKLTIPPQQTQP